MFRIMLSSATSSGTVLTDARAELINILSGTGLQTIEATAFASPKVVPQVSSICRSTEIYPSFILQMGDNTARAIWRALVGKLLFWEPGPSHVYLL